MYLVDQSIVEQTKKCDQNFACLNGSCYPSCKIASCVSNSVHFIEKFERDCPYHQEFGFSYVCMCPVRKEIYNKFAV